MRNSERQGVADPQWPQPNFTGGFPVQLRVGEYQILGGRRRCRDRGVGGGEGR